MKIIKNVLTNKTLDALFEDANNKTTGKCWSVNQLTWQEQLLVGSNGCCIQCDVSEDVASMVRDEILIDLPNYSKINFQHYIWTAGSGISMHDDGRYSFGATIYLCDSKFEDGGLFIWKNDEDDYRVYLPKYNTMVINDNKTEHMVTPVSFDSKTVRHTIQVWGER